MALSARNQVLDDKPPRGSGLHESIKHRVLWQCLVQTGAQGRGYCGYWLENCIAVV